jgi:putative oxidoreductase
MSWLSNAEAVGRFLTTGFFAVVFLQSGLDKLLDSEGNLAYIRGVFENSAVPESAVPLLFWTLTALELSAGGLCGLGILVGSFRHPGMGIAASGVFIAGLALIGLIAGQRIAKDYAGAAVIAAYFAVALIGISLF